MTKQKPHLTSVPTRGEEWVACRFALPAYVMDRDPPYRPEAVIWLSPQGIVHAGIFHPQEADASAVGKTLVEAMQHPMVGPPRKPGTVRVADAALVPPIRAVLGDSIAIHVRPVPEVEELRDFMARMPSGDGDETAAWTYDPAIPATLLVAFHRTAARLYQSAPWTAVPDDSHVLGVSVPAFGIESGTLSVIGQIGESYGFLLHRCLPDYLAFRRIAMTQRPPGEDRGAPRSMGAEVFSVNFERGADVPPRARQAFMRWGWELASSEAYPNILCADADLVARPLNQRDVTLALALCESLARFVNQHRDALSYGFSGSLSERYQSKEAGGIEVSLTAPHPQAAQEPSLELYDWGHFDPDDDDEDDDDDEYAEEIDGLVDEFVLAEEDRGRDQAWLQDAELLVDALCRFKLDHGADDLDRWTARDIQRFMIEHPLQPVSPDDELARRVPELLTAFVFWLTQGGWMSRRSAAALRKWLEEHREDYLRTPGLH